MNWEPQLRRDAKTYPAQAHKLLSDNRDRYIQQSASTEPGKLGELPPRAITEPFIED